MGDLDGPIIAKDVYQRLLHGESDFLDAGIVPWALDEAVRKLREKGLPPLRWAPYIHIGI
jgi:hypothetical protein